MGTFLYDIRSKMMSVKQEKGKISCVNTYIVVHKKINGSSQIT